jgi:hypothetical protein
MEKDTLGKRSTERESEIEGGANFGVKRIVGEERRMRESSVTSHP